MKTDLLYGRHAVLESLRAGRRDFRQLIMAQGMSESETLREIERLAQLHGIRSSQRPRNNLDSYSHGAAHQGVMLETSEYPYVDLIEILDHAQAIGQPPFILLLDLLQDVQNVGTLVRTAEAVGVHGVVLQDRRGASITPSVVNASSGASEHLRIAQVTNLVQSMKNLKHHDLWFAGLDTGSDGIRYDQADLTGAVGLVIGSEGHGVRRLVRENCDFIISLPMQGKIESLNAAVAGSIALYSIWQVRGFRANHPE